MPFGAPHTIQPNPNPNTIVIAAIIAFEPPALERFVPFFRAVVADAAAELNDETEVDVGVAMLMLVLFHMYSE